jgi:hypothetical protein
MGSATPSAVAVRNSRPSLSLPQDSPPQRLFFRTFHGSYKDSFEELPALLPEVWLHYDPKTVANRGRDALLRQRMDFLMLFSHGIRIVIEVDGKQHYAHADGRADPVAYGRMVAADRELRLAGYEVYRFGGVELERCSEAELVRVRRTIAAAASFLVLVARARCSLLVARARCSFLVLVPRARARPRSGQTRRLDVALAKVA